VWDLCARLYFKHLKSSFFPSHNTKERMFEARLVQGAILKKIIEAIRELVTDANLDCSSTGISMQVMKLSFREILTVVF
jgi:hypothetical protein